MIPMVATMPTSEAVEAAGSHDMMPVNNIISIFGIFSEVMGTFSYYLWFPYRDS